MKKLVVVIASLGFILSSGFFQDGKKLAELPPVYSQDVKELAELPPVYLKDKTELAELPPVYSPDLPRGSFSL